MNAKDGESGTDTRIAAQAVDQFPNIFKQTNWRANREKRDNGGRQKMNFCLRSKLRETNFCRLLQVVNGEVQFGELLQRLCIAEI